MTEPDQERPDPRTAVDQELERLPDEDAVGEDALDGGGPAGRTDVEGGAVP